jgi:hypothetical protein
VVDVKYVHNVHHVRDIKTWWTATTSTMETIPRSWENTPLRIGVGPVRKAVGFPDITRPGSRFAIN